MITDENTLDYLLTIASIIIYEIKSLDLLLIHHRNKRFVTFPLATIVVRLRYYIHQVLSIFPFLVVQSFLVFQKY